MDEKKDYTREDGTAFPDMAKVLPGLRTLIYKHAVIEFPLPYPIWVNVKNYTLWEPTGRGGFYRVLVSKKSVKEAIAEYMGREADRAPDLDGKCRCCGCPVEGDH